MKIAFVDNLLFEDAQGIQRYVLQPHLGLISLIAVLEKAGHEGELIDPKVCVSQGLMRLDENLYRQIAQRVMEARPDIVGFTSLGCNFICTAKVAGYLRQWRPDLPILLGGPHASVLAAEILGRFPQFDVVVRNEAERKILPLIESLGSRDFRDIPGLSYRQDGAVRSNPGDDLVEDVDSLPMPAYHRYPVRELGLESLRVDAGRGCPFQCTFCSTASFFGRKYRLKSAGRLLGELDFLHEEYGITDFALTHDLFTVNRRKVMEFCDAVRSRQYTWKCSARMDCVDAELLEHMNDAGCRSIYFGIEAGTERMQEISKKRLDLALFDPTLDSASRRKMSATVSFITGYPEETEEDQRATLDLIGHSFRRQAPLLNVQLHLLTPEPGTELLATYRDDIAYDGHISDFNFPSLEADDSQIIAQNPTVFINHHYFPSTLPRPRHVFVTTLYQVLYALGFPVLRHLMDVYDGRFSAVVDAMDAWRQREGLGPVADPDFVRRYFEAVHGVDSYLTGLVAYMSEAGELRRRASHEGLGRIVAGEWDDGARYRLSRRAAVVRNVPDCPRLLKDLVDRRLPAQDLSRRRKRFDFLLHLRSSQDDEVQNSVVTPACASLLEYFRRPRSVPEYLDSFGNETGLPIPSVAFLHSLFRQGILERVRQPA